MSALALCCFFSATIPLTGEVTTARGGRVTARYRPGALPPTAPHPLQMALALTPNIVRRHPGIWALCPVVSSRSRGRATRDLLLWDVEKQQPEAERLGGDGVSLATMAPELCGHKVTTLHGNGTRAPSDCWAVRASLSSPPPASVLTGIIIPISQKRKLSLREIR